MTNKICVYAISKNESQFVDKWVDSMSEADLIVVLDTGSTDDTVEKLKARGVTVYQKEIKPWRFDVARNEAMNLVPEEYNILVSTDLDEVFEPNWAEPLRNKWIEGVHQRALYKYTWSHLPNGADGRIFMYNKIHSRKWIWRYPVHELLWNKETSTETYSRDTQLNMWDDIHLHHYPDRSKSRSSYLELLEQRARDYKEDWYGLIYLGDEYYYRGKYQKAIDLFKKILSDYKDHYNTIEQASCYLFAGDSFRKLKDEKSAQEWYKKAIATDPTYREPWLNLAKSYIETSQNEKAVTCVKCALSETYRHYTWLERDTSWTYEPYDILCIAAYRAKMYKESVLYASKALSYEPENKRLLNNVSECVKALTIKDFI